MATPASTTSLARLSVPVRVGLGVALVLLFAAAYWLVFFTDVSGKIQSAQSQGNGLKSQLATQQQALATYFQDRDELALRQQRQRDLNKALPAETEAAAFLSSLQQVANVSGLDLLAWQPVEEKPEAYFVKVPMKLELSGKFQQVAKFSYEVGKLERIINLENIELTEPKLEGDEVHVKARCLATTFHVTKPKVAAANAGATTGTAPAGGTK